MNPETKQSIIDIINACQNVMLGTVALPRAGVVYPETRHVMNGLNREITDLEVLRFLTSNKSPKYAQLMANPNVCLYYFRESDHHVVRLFGQMEIVADADEVKASWRDEWKAYGYIGADDTTYTLLKFTPQIYKFYAGAELMEGAI